MGSRTVDTIRAKLDQLSHGTRNHSDKCHLGRRQIPGFHSCQWRDEWLAAPTRNSRYSWSWVSFTVNSFTGQIASLTSYSPFITEGDAIDFEPGSELPAHFTYWRFPIPSSYQVSAPGHANTLQLLPSQLNLTALNGNYAGPSGQTFVGRRQQDTLFTYSVDIDFPPTTLEAEAGVTVFLTQNHHLDLGVAMLPANSSTGVFPGPINATTLPGDASEPMLQFRFRGISSVAVPDPAIVPVPDVWREQKLRLEIRADNATHYTFSAGPANARSQMQTLVDASNTAVSWGFTGETFQPLSRFCSTEFVVRLRDY